MTIFGAELREELTQALAEHLYLQSQQRFLGFLETHGDPSLLPGQWRAIADDAIDFIYGQEPADETPEEEADHWSSHAGCCDIPGGPGFGCVCSTPAVPRRDQNPELEELTGVVRPPTNPVTLQVGQYLYVGDHPSQPEVYALGPELKTGQSAPLPREQDAADE